MKRTSVIIKGEKIIVTTHDVQTAMKQYNREFRVDQNDSGKRYAVGDGVGKTYPPKRLLSLAVKRPRTFFNGGKFTNRVFQDLDFRIGRVDGSAKASKLSPVLDQDAVVPGMNGLVDTLLRERWALLIGPPSYTPQWSAIKDGEYAGVYVLAYSDEPLARKRVGKREIAYVGMSHAGLKLRLKQFVSGIQRDCCHSGARTFFLNKSCGNGRSYSDIPIKRRKSFFVATVSVPCIVSKTRRSPLDLKKMGAVCELEMYVLASIKESIGREPELNTH
jgi:hypothetical protein